MVKMEKKQTQSILYLTFRRQNKLLFLNYFEVKLMFWRDFISSFKALPTTGSDQIWMRSITSLLCKKRGTSSSVPSNKLYIVQFLTCLPFLLKQYLTRLSCCYLYLGFDETDWHIFQPMWPAITVFADEENLYAFV